MKITIELDATTTDPAETGWLRELLERHAVTVVEAPAPAPAPARLLADVLATFGARDDRLASAEVCERLAATHPGRYAGWTPGHLAGQLAAHGLRPGLVSVAAGRFGFGLQLRPGFHRRDLEAAR